MTYKRKPLAILLGVLVLGFGGWYFWASSNSHGQGLVESHEHFHVHGQGIDHGHEHSDADESTSHSHAHKHDRHHHSDAEMPDDPELTEIGHYHNASNGTTHYWAKLVAGDDGKFVLKFYESQESVLKTSAPTADNFEAMILNGSKMDGDLKFEKVGDNFVAELPKDFFALPTHVFKIQNLEFGDLKIDAMLSIVK